MTIKKLVEEYSQISKWELFHSFIERLAISMKDSSDKCHSSSIISSIQHEDGSGCSFNIVMRNGEKFHIKTLD